MSATRILCMAAVLAAGFATGAAAQSPPTSDLWPELAHLFFQDRSIAEDSASLTLDAPARAEDAALAPVTLSARLPDGDPRRVVKLSLVIDENPVPLAGVFTLGERTNGIRISTRVRIDAYTNVHLVAELSDGSLRMTTRYVKAAGGCSAPMAKSPDDANATMGQMKFRMLPVTASGEQEALIMLRHPNNSGLQMDQITHLYAPARYIDHFAVYQGDELVFSVEGGISISEDPNFRFTFTPNGAKSFRVDATDTNGAHFTGSWSAARGGA
jgi:sulfur-oxidizing protein SoxY